MAPWLQLRLDFVYLMAMLMDERSLGESVPHRPSGQCQILTLMILLNDFTRCQCPAFENFDAYSIMTDLQYRL